MLANITVPLVGIVDAAVIGHLPDHRLLAAVNLGAASISTLYFLFGFLRMATSGLAAQAYGAGDTAALRKTFRSAVLLASVLGLLLFISQDLSIRASALLASADESLPLLRDYLHYRLMAAPFALVSWVTTAVLIATDRAALAVAIQIGANLINVALDIILVQHGQFAVVGVAVASAVAETSACLLGLYVLRDYLRPGTAIDKKASGGMWRKILRVNRDIFIRSALIVSVTYSLTAISGQFGSLALAGCGVLLNLFYLCSYGLDGFAHAAEVLAGQAYGAGRARDLRQYVRASSVWAALFACLISACFWYFGEALIAMQTNIDAVQLFAKSYLGWFIALPLLGATAFQLDGVFIGTTRSAEMRNSMMLSTAAYLLALTTLPRWGLDGLWFSLCVFMVARGVILSAFYPRIYKGLAHA